MKFTNENNLPQGIYDAITRGSYSVGKADYSVSQIASPPQARKLISLFSDKITIDISDEIWKLLGSSVHYILVKAAGVVDTDEPTTRINKALLHLKSVGDREDKFEIMTNESLAGFIDEFIQTTVMLLSTPDPTAQKNPILREERIYGKIGGLTVSGQPDQVDTSLKKIEDYKVTSVWKILSQNYEDWEFQLNVYALLCDLNSIPIDELQINAILRDWKKFEYEQKRDENYPPHPVVVIPIPKWDLLVTAQKVIEKLIDHQKLKYIDDPEEIYKARPCTLEEKWHGEDKFAVVRSGNKRATKVFDTEEEAKQFATIKGYDYLVERRLGEDKRCEEFCLAKPFCAQYRVEHMPEVSGSSDKPDANLNLLNLLPDSPPAEIPEDILKASEPSGGQQEESLSANESIDDILAGFRDLKEKPKINFLDELGG